MHRIQEGCVRKRRSRGGDGWGCIEEGCGWWLGGCWRRHEGKMGHLEDCKKNKNRLADREVPFYEIKKMDMCSGDWRLGVGGERGGWGLVVGRV